jgi:hypothetical protein
MGQGDFLASGGSPPISHSKLKSSFPTARESAEIVKITAYKKELFTANIYSVFFISTIVLKPRSIP